MDCGLTATLEFEVTDEDTAQSLLSGDVAVLGTPRLVAWLEAATCAAVRGDLPSGHTTVGTQIHVDHLAPSPVGARVAVTATLTRVAGRTLTFDVVAVDEQSNAVLGRGHVTRLVVDRQAFQARAGH